MREHGRYRMVSLDILQEIDPGFFLKERVWSILKNKL